MSADDAPGKPLALLQLRWAHREGMEFQDDDGRVVGRSSPRQYLDFVIDGRSLQERLDDGDKITEFGCEAATSWWEQALNALLLLTPSELPEDQCVLYVCPECGDLGCGAYTAVVPKHGGVVVWSDFAHYLPWGSEPPYYQLERVAYNEVGPFAFEADEYERVLRAGVRQLESCPAPES